MFFLLFDYNYFVCVFPIQLELVPNKPAKKITVWEL